MPASVFRHISMDAACWPFVNTFYLFSFTSFIIEATTYIAFSKEFAASKGLSNVDVGWWWEGNDYGRLIRIECLDTNAVIFNRFEALFLFIYVHPVLSCPLISTHVNSYNGFETGI